MCSILNYLARDHLPTRSKVSRRMTQLQFSCSGYVNQFSFQSVDSVWIRWEDSHPSLQIDNLLDHPSRGSRALELTSTGRIGLRKESNQRSTIDFCVG